MYNKKKKHFHNGQKPHYTRQEFGPDGKPLPQPERTEPANNEVSGEVSAINSTAENNGTYVAGSSPEVTEDRSEAVNEQQADSSETALPQAETPKTVPANPANPDDVVIYPFKSKNNPNPVGLPVDPNAPPVTNCQICNMPVRSVNTAVHHKESGELVHFDCALRELTKEFTPKLGRGRKVYYVGAGNFAVVKEIYDRRGRLKSYEVVERIPYEPEEK